MVVFDVYTTGGLYYSLLIRYLGLFERTLKYNNGGQGFFVGDKVTEWHSTTYCALY